MKQIKIEIRFNIAEKLMTNSKFQDVKDLITEVKQLEKEFREDYSEEIAKGEVADICFDGSIK